MNPLNGKNEPTHLIYGCSDMSAYTENEKTGQELSLISNALDWLFNIPLSADRKREPIFMTQIGQVRLVIIQNSTATEIVIGY